MSESELGGFIQVAPYPLEAVPYQLFAKMIGRKESTVRTMIDAAKLPTIDFVKPGSVKTRASENWVYSLSDTHATPDAVLSARSAYSPPLLPAQKTGSRSPERQKELAG
ncbi:Cox family DNA-binding protein [Escherichia coli]|uniref:Cox family DNA-binding protein n=2 Tax=Escherichia coli TaxID=562 RepID=UPI002485BCED|nr:Cox family DNA-binding protein [Escherichia coli]